MSEVEQFLTEPSPEQRALADSVERFVRDQYPLEKRRETIASAKGYDREIWSAFAELGWLAIPFAEDDGGLGGNHRDMEMVVSMLGHGAVLEPYLHAVALTGSLLAGAPSGALRDNLIETTISGQGFATLATMDVASRADSGFAGVESRNSYAGLELHGQLVFVPFAEEAEMILVPVAGSNGFSIYGVRPKEVEVRAYETVDGGRAADVVLNGVRVDQSRLLVGADRASALCRESLRVAVFCACAEAVAIMGALIRSTVEYAKTRKQFGQPIGNFQAYGHAVADMGIDFSHAEAATWIAGHQLNASDVALQDKLLAAAKYEVGRAGRSIGQRAVQLHGGVGMTDELIVGHYFKRLIGLDLLYGGWQRWLQTFVTGRNYLAHSG